MSEKKPWRTILLSTGKTAKIVEPLGRHLRMAQRVAGRHTEKLMYALIALVTKIDGKPVVMEDLDDMKLVDVVALQEAIDGETSEREDESEKNSLPPNTSHT